MIPLFAPRAHEWGARNLANCTILTKNFAKLCATCLLQFILKYGILYMSRGDARWHRVPQDAKGSTPYTDEYKRPSKKIWKKFSKTS